MPSGADAALAVVPLAVHGQATREALAAGLHVLVEKPFTDDLAEAAALVALARERRPRADGQPELPLVPGAAAGARAAARGRDRPAARLLPRLPFPVRQRLPLLLPRGAPAQRHGDPPLRRPALRAGRRAGLDQLRQLERARHAVQGPPRGARHDPLRGRGDRELPRQLDLARADHALWRPLADRRHQGRDRVHLPRRLRGARQARPPDALPAGAAPREGAAAEAAVHGPDGRARRLRRMGAGRAGRPRASAARRTT